MDTDTKTTWRFMVEDTEGMRVPLELNGVVRTFHSSDAAWNETNIGPAATFGEEIFEHDGRRVILVRSDQPEPIASWPTTATS